MKEYYDFGGTLYALPFRQGCRHLSSSVVIFRCHCVAFFIVLHCVLNDSSGFGVVVIRGDFCCHYVAFSLFYIVFWTISMVQGCRHLRSSVVVFAVILWRFLCFTLCFERFPWFWATHCVVMFVVICVAIMLRFRCFTLRFERFPWFWATHVVVMSPGIFMGRRPPAADPVQKVMFVLNRLES